MHFTAFASSTCVAVRHLETSFTAATVPARCHSLRPRTAPEASRSSETPSQASDQKELPDLVLLPCTCSAALSGVTLAATEIQELLGREPGYNNRRFVTNDSCTVQSHHARSVYGTSFAGTQSIDCGSGHGNTLSSPSELRDSESMPNRNTSQHDSHKHTAMLGQRLVCDERASPSLGDERAISSTCQCHDCAWSASPVCSSRSKTAIVSPYSPLWLATIMCRPDGDKLIPRGQLMLSPTQPTCSRTVSSGAPGVSVTAKQITEDRAGSTARLEPYT